MAPMLVAWLNAMFLAEMQLPVILCLECSVLKNKQLNSVSVAGNNRNNHLNNERRKSCYEKPVTNFALLAERCFTFMMNPTIH